MSRVLATVAAVAVVVSSFAVNTNIALGHERRAVGPYPFVVGWINEPAYVNVANGLSLDVTETSGSKPVEGLASTLRAEVIVGGGAKKLSLDLATGEATPGHYEGRFIPTKAGDYIFHIFGVAGARKGGVRFPFGAKTLLGAASPGPPQFPHPGPAHAGLAAPLAPPSTPVFAPT